jgi:hypothetical protein
MLAKSGDVQAVRKYLEPLRSWEIAVRELLGPADVVAFRLKFLYERCFFENSSSTYIASIEAFYRKR